MADLGTHENKITKLEAEVRQLKIEVSSLTAQFDLASRTIGDLVAAVNRLSSGTRPLVG